MELYRMEDIKAITDNLDKIIEESSIVKNHTLEPTIEEYKKAIQISKDFISSKKRIIYGGKAYDELIKLKNESDKIYKEYSRSDIEFYTPEPISDLVELCNILYEQKFTFVSGRQAEHDGTYKIYVNFENICDITYMPKNIFGNMPAVTIDKILYSHPMWILIDILRQYNDPITSYWRLRDKLFFRATTLLKHYPLELVTLSSFTYKDTHNNEKINLFKKMMSMESIIFTGSIAETYYLTLKSQINTSHIEVFSTNFRDDVKAIIEFLKEIFSDKYDQLTINYYVPFYQFWDERVEISLKDECIIKIFGNKIFGNNEMCIPYNNLFISDSKINKIQVGGFRSKIKNNIGGSDEKCIKIATFILLFNHLLIHRQYEYINRTEIYKKYEKIMHGLLNKRNTYLKENKKTVMDNTPYREFIIRCNGITVNSTRKYRLQQLNKKLKGRVIVFNYNPETQQKTFTLPEYKFSNISGNLNDKGLIRLLNEKEDKEDKEKD